MATYTELYDLRSNDDLKNKTAIAVAIKAAAIIDDGSATVAQVTWALEALQAPLSKADELLVYVIASNAGLSVAQITGASDSALQTAVDTAADKLIAGGI